MGGVALRTSRSFARRCGGAATLGLFEQLHWLSHHDRKKKTLKERGEKRRIRRRGGNTTEKEKGMSRSSSSLFPSPFLTSVVL